MNTNLVIIIFTSISFIIYGINSFTSNRMVNEYERWGFGKYRKIIGDFAYNYILHDVIYNIVLFFFFLGPTLFQWKTKKV